MTVSEINESDWITGPAWFESDSSKWPVQPEVFEPGEIETEEAYLLPESIPHKSSLLDWSGYSSFNQLINIIIKCLLFIKLKRLTLADRHKLAEKF